MPETDGRRAGLTLATRVTLARILLALFLGPLILYFSPLVGAGLIALAGVTDFLDGYLARARGEVTKFGAALDPIADKLIALSALIAFTANGTLTGIHLYAVFAILLREILIAGLREAAADTVSMGVSALAKWKTTIQFLAFIALCFGPTPIALGLLWMAAILTVWTGTSYIIRWWANVS
ncbi:MAG: CDP-diacylglycerol--glycerol-3-phosphate 3-phosphatidyltransferase [Pseudomonadota bacterium]